MNAPASRNEVESLRSALPPTLTRQRLPDNRTGTSATAPVAPRFVQPWREALALLEQHVPFTRRMVHAGDLVHAGGEAFSALHILNSGMVRSVNFSADGREQVVGLHFHGDWLGFDGIASGRYGCDAIAMDTGEVWTFRYDALLLACATAPALHGRDARGDEPGDRARPRFADVAVHAAGRGAGRRLPAILGRKPARSRPAHRPDHAAHDACRDRQLPRHDAGDGEPGAVAAGAQRA